MEVSKLQLSPVREIQLSSGLKAHHQKLTHNGIDLQFQTLAFHSAYGIRPSQSGKPQLLVAFDDNLKNMLLQVQDFVKAQIQIPEEIKEKAVKNYVYKPLYHGNCAFMTLANDFEGFDAQGNPLPDNFVYGAGMYTVLFRVAGLYIGSHGNTPYLASIQFRILQVLYTPKLRGVCRIAIQSQLTEPESKPAAPSTELDMTVDIDELDNVEVVANKVRIAGKKMPKVVDEEPPSTPKTARMPPPKCPNAPKKRTSTSTGDKGRKPRKLNLERQDAFYNKEKSDSSKSLDEILDDVSAGQL